MRSLFKPDDAYGNIKVEKLLWDKSNVICFRDVLSDNLVDLDLLVDRIVNENLSIDDGVSNFGAILYNKAYEVFGQLKIIHNGRSCTQRKNSSPWFNNDCVIARAELKRANKLFRKYRTLEYHEHVVNGRKQYRKVKRRAQFNYKQNQRQKLHEMAINNPRGFWHEIKRMKVDGSSPSKIVLSDFFDHFKHLFSDGNSFTADHVEQFINQKFNENSTSTDTDQPYDTSLLDAQAMR